MAADAGAGSGKVEWIVAPLDGSAFGEQALPYVRQLARALNVPVLLVTAAHVDALAVSDPTGGAVSGEVLTTLLDAELGAARDYLARVQADLERDGLRVETKSEFGYPAGFVRDAIEAKPNALVVMTTHGRGGIVRATLGSVADQIVRSGGRPVIVVRPAQAGETPAAPTIGHIVIGLDGSELSEAVLPAAATIARAIGAPVTLLRAVDSDAETAAAQLYLADMAASLGAAGIQATTRVVVAHPAEAILDTAAATNDSLIALSTHGRSGLGRWLTGSTTERVLQATTHPLLVVRGHEAKPA